MNYHIKSIFVLFYLFVALGAKAVLPSKVEEAFVLGLPVVEVITVDGEEPYCEYVSAPSGSWGSSITDATKVPGSVTVSNPDGTISYSSGDYEKGESGMTIKIRGNTSAYGDKKPYKIKLQKKGDLLGRDDKKFNDKNWVLLNDYSLKQYMGFEISRLMDFEWTPTCEFINLFINGDYRGIYLLAEAVERNENCRVNVSEEGFIVEHDAYWWNENGEYLPSIYSPQYNYTFKYPDYEDLSPEEIDIVSDILSEYEESIAKGDYNDYIDVNSFARWMLAHDIMGTSDGGGVNFYLTKYDATKDTPIMAGPLWDFDSAEKRLNKWSAVHETERFKSLFNNINTSFYTEYLNVWEKYGAKIFCGIEEILSDMNDEEQWKAYNESQIMDGERWDCEPDHSSYFHDRMEAWYQQRKIWLEEQLGTLPDENAGVQSPLENKRLFAINKNGIIPLEDGRRVMIYTPDGKIIVKSTSRKNGLIEISCSGIYIVSFDGIVSKIKIN